MTGQRVTENQLQGSAEAVYKLSSYGLDKSLRMC